MKNTKQNTSSQTSNVASNTSNVNASNVAITTRNATIEYDVHASINCDVMRERIAQRIDESNDAFTRRVNECVALLNRLRDRNDATRVNDRDARAIRVALRKRDYYIHKYERRASSIVSSIIATTLTNVNA